MMVETKNFGELQLSREVFKAVSDMGFEEPSPIQAQVIPVILEGRDVLGQAQTGTGKTAAFGIPVVEMVNPRLHQVQAIMLAPTRELAIQVAEELAKIGKHRHLKTVPIYGGQPIDRQIRALRFGAHIVIGTPGRVLDHLNRKTLKLEQVKFVVLDEADEMLDMGFVEDIETILRRTPEERQTLLFSATMPIEIKKLANKFMRDPVTISVSRDELTVPQIDQVFYEAREKNKVDALCRVIDMEDIRQAIIFCRTKRGVDELVAGLESRGYIASGLHGDLSQTQRDRVMKRFREGRAELLVATDVAARGLDIENVTHVINYDVPQDPESYVHRIGRTGRAGKKGQAITLIVPREYRQLRLIEKLVKTRIQRQELPTQADLAERQLESLRGHLVNVIEEGKLMAYRNLVAELMEEYDSVEVAAAALKYAIEGVGGSQEPEINDDDEVDFGNTGARSGMVRLFMNIGRANQIRPQDIIRTIAEEAGIPGNIIGLINIYEKFTFVEVPQDVAARVMYSMHHNLIKGKRVSVEPAKART